MGRMVARLCILFSCLLVASLHGCTNVTQLGTCVPGASMACPCPAGQQGTQTCTSATTFAACVCSAPTVDTGGGGGGGGAAASLPDAAAVSGNGGSSTTIPGIGGATATGGESSASTSAGGQVGPPQDAQVPDTQGTVGLPPECVPGASVACTCMSRQPGAQVCTSAGRFAPCVCAASTMDAGGADAASGGGASATGGAAGGSGASLCKSLWGSLARACFVSALATSPAWVPSVPGVRTGRASRRRFR
jgi:hypothetical protein